MTKFKIQNKSNGSTTLTIGTERSRSAKIQNKKFCPECSVSTQCYFGMPKSRYLIDYIRHHLCFVLCYFFVICALLFGFVANSYALNLDRARSYFLNGDYQGCINECEGILAQSRYSKELDELYYLLGLGYLKTGDFLRSFDVFEIIIKEFRGSPYTLEARLSQADVYFLKEDYKTALAKYEQILKNHAQDRLIPLIYFRLAQTQLKNGSWKEARQYADRLEREYPLSFERQLAQNLFSKELYFTVQVGAFSKQTNAQNLCDELVAKGYPAFIQEAESRLGRVFRVRVGKLDSRIEAKSLEQKLIQEGYPTNIFP